MDDGRRLDVDGMLAAIVGLAPDGATATYELGHKYGRMVTVRWRSEKGERIHELRRMVDQYVKHGAFEPESDIIGGIRNALLEEFPSAQSKPGYREAGVPMERDRHDGRWLREFTDNHIMDGDYPSDKFKEAVRMLKDDAAALSDALNDLNEMIEWDLRRDKWTTQQN